jgi:multidrug efflux pump subunit AcrA (membrane-fusion protein)
MLRTRRPGGRAGQLLAGMALVALGGGCDQKEDKAQQGMPSPPVVTVSRPVQHEIVEWDEYSGRFDAVETVEVRARVSGHLAEVRFKDGQPTRTAVVMTPRCPTRGHRLSTKVRR